MAAVLVVDDDVAIRETLRMALEDEGYEVYEASDGIAALGALRASQHPLVVLLDLMMPRLDGAGVLDAVARDEPLRQHVYVMITAKYQGLPRQLRESLSRLDVPVLAKPLDLDRLFDAVAAAAERLPAG